MMSWLLAITLWSVSKTQTFYIRNKVPIISNLATLLFVSKKRPYGTKRFGTLKRDTNLFSLHFNTIWFCFDLFLLFTLFTIIFLLFFIYTLFIYTLYKYTMYYIHSKNITVIYPWHTWQSASLCVFRINTSETKDFSFNSMPHFTLPKCYVPQLHRY